MNKLSYILIIAIFTMSFSSALSDSSCSVYGICGNNQALTVIVNQTNQINNSEYLQGYQWANAPYPGSLYSTYNLTYHTWAYNQTTPAINYFNSIYSGTYNITYDSTSQDVTANRSSWFSTFNSTYATWSYNQTSPAIAYTNSNPFNWINVSSVYNGSYMLTDGTNSENIVYLKNLNLVGGAGGSNIFFTTSSEDQGVYGVDSGSTLEAKLISLSDDYGLSAGYFWNDYGASLRLATKKTDMGLADYIPFAIDSRGTTSLKGTAHEIRPDFVFTTDGGTSDPAVAGTYTEHYYTYNDKPVWTNSEMYIFYDADSSVWRVYSLTTTGAVGWYKDSPDQTNPLGTYVAEGVDVSGTFDINEDSLGSHLVINDLWNGNDNLQFRGTSRFYDGTYTFGSGGAIGTSSDAFIMTSSLNEDNTGIITNRGAFAGANTISLITGGNINSGWNMGLKASDGKFYLRNNAGAYDTLIADLGNNITVGRNLTVSGNLFAGSSKITGNANITQNLVVLGNVSIKKPYGMYSSTQTQTIAVANTAYPVTFNWTEDDYQMRKSNDNANFTAGQTGDYLIELSAIAVTDLPNKHIEIWVQKNGINVPRSNTHVEITNAGTEQVIAVPFIIDLNTTDKFRIMYASDDAGTQLLYTPATSYSPETPSIIMTFSKISEVTP